MPVQIWEDRAIDPPLQQKHSRETKGIEVLLERPEAAHGRTRIAAAPMKQQPVRYCGVPRLPDLVD
jgi:hypothetical protein